MTTPLVPQAFSSPLSGNEILTAYSSNGSAIGVSGQNFQLTTGQIAALANTDGGVGLTIGGVATGSFSQASNTTLANVTGMVATVVAGGTYILDAYLSTTNNATGGIKLGLNGGTATATLFVADTWVYNTTTVSAEVNVTSLSSNLVASAVASTAVAIGGTLVVATGGTIQLQAAQDVSNSTALTIANGSYLQLTRIG